MERFNPKDPDIKPFFDEELVLLTEDKIKKLSADQRGSVKMKIAAIMELMMKMTLASNVAIKNAKERLNRLPDTNASANDFDDQLLQESIDLEERENAKQIIDKQTSFIGQISLLSNMYLRVIKLLKKFEEIPENETV